MMIEKSIISVVTVVLCLFVALFSQPLLTDENETYDYKGETFNCGLYDGTNDIPDEHFEAGMEIAREMREMSRVNIVAIGHSVPTNIFNSWNWNNAKSNFDLAENTNFSSACAGAVMAWDWVNTMKGNVSSLGGISADEVHVLVVQVTWAPFFGPDNDQRNLTLTAKFEKYKSDLYDIVQGAKRNFSNLKMILLQADPWQNDHEPYHAYHEWLISRHVVLEQINGVDEVSYKGENPKTVWMSLGGYFWYPNAPGSYYMDCCHITGEGPAHFQEKWINGLLDYNPVVSHWLLDVPVEVNRIPQHFSSKIAFHSFVKENSVEVVFSLAGAKQLSMGLFSVDGRCIVPMAKKECKAGLNYIPLTAKRNLTPGAYIVRVNGTAGLRTLDPVIVIK